nr:reverse transcriptase domain-containing protein [Tanacetum cinerariifolium]
GSDEFIHPSPIPFEKDTEGNEKVKEKDEPLEKLPEGKPPEKVMIHDDHTDQTITIGGNLTAECRANGKKFRSLHGRHGLQEQRIYSDFRRNQSKYEKNKGCNEHALAKQPKLNAAAKWKTSRQVEEAFQTKKKLIAELSTLTVPKKEEELMVYLSSANEAVSAILLVERDGRQTPIHYVVRTPQGAEINYPPMEKLVLALVHDARRNPTRRYHQSTNNSRKGMQLHHRGESLISETILRATALMHRAVHKAMNAGYFWPRGAWVEELPNVLWAHRTTPKTSNRDTPFSLAYGTEAVIPAEIGIPTRRTIQGSDKENNEALRLNLNLLEERREIAAIKEARRKQQVEKYYNQ